MVKIPGLDDLKKMGSDLMDSAKTVKLGGMVDKLKSGMDAMGGKKEVAQSDDELKRLFTELQSALNDISSAQATQSVAVKKMQNLLSELANVTATYQKPAPASEPAANNEGEKK